MEANPIVSGLMSRFIRPDTVGSAPKPHCIDLRLGPPSAELGLLAQLWGRKAAKGHRTSNSVKGRGPTLIQWGLEADPTVSGLMSRFIGPDTVGSASKPHCIDLRLGPPSAELGLLAQLWGRKAAKGHRTSNSVKGRGPTLIQWGLEADPTVSTLGWAPLLQNWGLPYSANPAPCPADPTMSRLIGPNPVGSALI